MLGTSPSSSTWKERDDAGRHVVPGHEWHECSIPRLLWTEPVVSVGRYWNVLERAMDTNCWIQERDNRIPRAVNAKLCALERVAIWPRTGGLEVSTQKRAYIRA